ncbi:hypothetical protein QMS90_10230 [Cronobacter sakazakii]|uniref:hypothetical protein n=1 Tax=Enterobacteriaceae TaxID=543 RepID=UPI000948B648|nr:MULTISPECIES: hypothetical protein [Enterobacteriaceae]EFN9483885.1 hypothetical protein [Escherichia coli]EGT4309538.1 hypothetical protein [Cronobacter sakazakii]EGT4368316.1 hypothetical protein [Cronobacter sakazakii]EME2025899.1 hypothetical protein [Cronobacter sakazakii]EME2064717.1 hypothetical protein [Cronobacter sakazakii]
MTLSITDIQRINTLAHKHLKNNEEIAAETGHTLTDIDAVIRGVYVDDLAENWKDDADITLAEYNAIRSRYKPGKLHRDTEFMIARDMLIRPETVLAIAHSRFSNAHTHPMPKAVKAKPEKPQTMRRLLSADLDQMHKLERFGWKQTEIAGELGISVEAVAHVLRLMRNRWSYPDILEDVNTRFGAK